LTDVIVFGVAAFDDLENYGTVKPLRVADSTSNAPASLARPWEMRWFETCQSVLLMAKAFYLGYEQSLKTKASIGMAKGGSEVFGDGDGKVGEVGLLIPWRRPFSCVTYTCRKACLVECDA
jgi:hypothetical protein